MYIRRPQLIPCMVYRQIKACTHTRSHNNNVIMLSGQGKRSDRVPDFVTTVAATGFLCVFNTAALDTHVIRTPMSNNRYWVFHLQH